MGNTFWIETASETALQCTHVCNPNAWTTKNFTTNTEKIDADCVRASLDSSALQELLFDISIEGTMPLTVCRDILWDPYDENVTHSLASYFVEILNPISQYSLAYMWVLPCVTTYPSGQFTLCTKDSDRKYKENDSGLGRKSYNAHRLCSDDCQDNRKVFYSRNLTVTYSWRPDWKQTESSVGIPSATSNGELVQSISLHHWRWKYF